MSKESSSPSAVLDIGSRIPLWDVLSCNAYLVSLLPIDDVLRYVPGLGADHDLHDILRFFAAGWLLWRQQLLRQRQQSTIEPRGIFQNSRQVALVCLLAMDGLPILCRWIIKQFPSRPVLVPISNSPDSNPRITQLATQRREKLRRLFQSLWPLLRLGLWIQLARSSSEEKKDDGATTKGLSSSQQPSPLHVLYAHRRWLQEQGMELWPIMVEPLLHSTRETKRWLRQLWHQFFI